MSLLTKSSPLPPLPANLGDLLIVENVRPNMPLDHGVVTVQFEAPSGRGAEYPLDRLSLRVFGAANGYLTVRGSLGSNLAGMPQESRDTLNVTFPIDLLRPLLAGLEQAGGVLALHEKQVERAATLRGELSEALRNGWRWF